MKTPKILFAALLFLSIFSTSCQKAATASFTYSQNTSGTVNFTNTSNRATTYNWNFGDGASTTETNPSHTYSNAGTYNVTLTADGTGGSGSNTQSISVL
jgi:PKD repeat protein